MNRQLNEGRAYSTLDKSGSGNEHVYYNVVIPYQPNSNLQTDAEFTENRTQEIIDNPNNYYLSVIRFYIPGQTIPITEFPIIPYPNTDPNKTTLSVILSYNGINSTETSLEYVSGNQFGIPPPAATPTNPNYPTNNRYYFIYNYQALINTANAAFVAALTNLKTMPGTGAIAGAVAPFLTYDPNTQLFTLHANSGFYDYTITTPIKIFVNVPFISFFDAFPMLLTNLGLFSPLTPGGFTSTYQILITNDGINTVGGIMSLSQEYITTGKINLFKSILMTSNTVPVQTENLTISGGSGINIGKPIMTDFEPLVNDTSGQSRAIFQYYPTGPYRLVNLTSSSPLRKFDVKVFWQDRFQNVYPLYIGYNDILTIKFLFVKKSVYNSNMDTK